jgi:hypothetical protein
VPSFIETITEMLLFIETITEMLLFIETITEMLLFIEVVCKIWCRHVAGSSVCTQVRICHLIISPILSIKRLIPNSYGAEGSSLLTTFPIMYAL